MIKYTRAFVGNYLGDDISQSPMVRSIQQVSTLGIGREALTSIVKRSLELIYDETIVLRDYYGAIRKAMEQSEANQPLGILIAEELGIPFVLTTSTYHHDILTQPVQNYASRKGWILIDCSPDNPNEKATPGFWRRAYDNLK
ncbi:MAG: hypothetical protein J4473_04470 [Candidatus Aenigmarchaeota archaeon]|nr:hypothetical protein [Candidatus Aenigmarchaeota archaeon]